MAVSNITNVEFGNLTMVETEPHYQYDYGQKLKFTDLNLPSSYEVHFANDATTGIAYTQLGDSTGVTIPNALFRTGKPIFAFIYLHKGSDDGKTVYVVKIPVRSRAKPSDMVVPSEEETSIIRDAIAALQAAIEAVEITEEEVAEMVSDKVEEIFNDPDIGEKIPALSIVIDSTPTQGSDNAVSSGGVASYFSQTMDVIDALDERVTALEASGDMPNADTTRY